MKLLGSMSYILVCILVNGVVQQDRTWGKVKLACFTKDASWLHTNLHPLSKNQSA